MKKWKTILLVLGVLLLFAALATYAARIASCYPPASLWVQFAPEYIKGLREACQLDSPLTTQFAWFLGFFIPGILVFSAYWLLMRPTVKKRHAGFILNSFLLLLMLDSLLVMLYGLLEYPAPGVANAPAAWVMESIAGLAFLCYLACLALWYWKRWGLFLFQFASVSLAIFILLSRGSIILAAVIAGGVIVLSLLLRPMRKRLV